VQALRQLSLEQLKRDEEQRKRDEEAREEQRKRDEEQRKRDERVLTSLEDSHTTIKSMSKATENFTTPLLNGLGITWSRADGNKEPGQNYTFDWSSGEDARTEAATAYLKQLLGNLPVDNDLRPLELVDVHTKSLPSLKSCGKKAKGKTDAVVRFEEILVDDGAEFAFGVGLVEFKTIKAPFKACQLLLEEVCLSRVSKYGESVVLLGTDLNSKWQVCYFDKLHHITCQSFKFGSVALEFFKTMLRSVHQRANSLCLMASIQEARLGLHAVESDQALDGFEGVSNEIVDRVQDLQQLARYFKEQLNADVTVPAWACSGMYS